MSDQKTSVIKKVELKEEAWNNTFYFHKVEFENGDKGEIGGCKEKDPDWLKKGKSITYTTKQGRWCMVFTPVSQQNPSGSGFQQRSFNRETEEQWRMNKRSVILDSCLNRAKDLAIAKAQGYDPKNYRKKAVEEYEFIIQFIQLESGVSRELELQIRSCETQEDLALLHKDLSKEEAKNPKVIELINDQEKVIANKK
jgi:hypothetical protein